MVVELGKGLPIIGGFVKAGAALRELFTGEQAAIKKITEETESINKLIDLSNDLEETHKKNLADNLAILQNIRAEREKINATPERQGLIAAGQGETSAAAEAEKRFNEERTKLRQTSEEQQKRLRIALDLARQKFVTQVNPNRGLAGESTFIRVPDQDAINKASTALDKAKKKENDRLAELEQQRQDTLKEIREKARTEEQKSVDDEFKRQQEQKKKQTVDETEEIRKRGDAEIEARQKTAKILGTLSEAPSPDALIAEIRENRALGVELLAEMAQLRSELATVLAHLRPSTRSGRG